MSVPSPLSHTHRQLEKQNIAQLTMKFKEYTDQVRQMREHCKKTENNVFLSHIAALDNEIKDLQSIYERELDSVRGQLDACIAERNQLHLDASKYGALSKEFQDKYNEEKTTRTKLENALADAHRVLTEKDALLQELHISIAQHQNAHLDTAKERDELQSQNTSLKVTCDSESKMRIDLEAYVQKLTEQINFEREIHEKDVIDLRNRNAAAERTIEIADQKLREHDLVDEKLQQQIENIRRQTTYDFIQYQEASENSYQLQLQEHKNRMAKETQALTQQKEENIHLKAIIEEMNAKIYKLDGKVSSYHEQNTILIHTLEVERRAAAATCHELEKKLQELQEHYNTKVRELNIVSSVNIPIDLELESLSQLIEAEAKRLDVALSNPSSDLISTVRGELVSNRSHYVHNASPRKASSNAPLKRQKSPAALVDTTTELPPLINPLPKYTTNLPSINDIKSRNYPSYSNRNFYIEK
ncbi:lamin-C [Hydra vulgaris]|uniref:Nematocilin B n=1 Tax=Hydra vulgaris TaxID=6087 RepID=B3A0T0_HYDVU|nr:lamin-C [Hydra vulgaris]BAG48262.1 nematocilin B [Hydra vulgaris]